VVPKIIKTQGPSLSKINNPSYDGANRVFIKTEIIQAKRNIGILILDITEFTIGLVDLYPNISIFSFHSASQSFHLIDVILISVIIS
jgi:hypothetical protein